MAITHITPDQLKQLMKEDPSLMVLDVRTPEEFAYLGHIEGATLLPLHQIPGAYSSLDATKPMVVTCQHGVRSMDACLFLQNAGFTKLYNLADGMAVWDGPIEREALPQ